VKTPRNVNGPQFVKALKRLGYERIRQDGSHILLSTQQNGEHHVSASDLTLKFLSLRLPAS
jgi:predicted RNA binding protein YcfA (HicA-like mRNA interferase family)